MTELLSLLQELRGLLLGLRDKALSRNNMETLAADLVPNIDIAIAYLESTSERKCRTCKHWEITKDNPSFGECSQLDDIGTHEHFFCAYWQPCGEPK